MLISSSIARGLAFEFGMRVEKLFQLNRAFGQWLRECQLDFVYLVEFFFRDLGGGFLCDRSSYLAVAAAFLRPGVW